jgi:hypothetical protein
MGNALQEASSQQVSAGLLPQTLALEGVRMRYLIDSCVDEMLAAVYSSITSPPLLQNPLGKVLSMVRQFGCRMELGQAMGAHLEQIQSNRLTKVGPHGSFIYAGNSQCEPQQLRARDICIH